MGEGEREGRRAGRERGRVRIGRRLGGGRRERTDAAERGRTGGDRGGGDIERAVGVEG